MQKQYESAAKTFFECIFLLLSFSQYLSDDDMSQFFGNMRHQKILVWMFLMCLRWQLFFKKEITNEISIFSIFKNHTICSLISEQKKSFISKKNTQQLPDSRAYPKWFINLLSTSLYTSFAAMYSLYASPRLYTVNRKDK